MSLAARTEKRTTAKTEEEPAFPASLQGSHLVRAMRLVPGLLVSVIGHVPTSRMSMAAHCKLYKVCYR